MVAVSQLIGHVEHTLGGAVSPQLGGSLAVVNAAGRHLFSMHPWASASRATASLGFSANQEWIPLPEDFGEIDTIAAVNGLERVVRTTTMSEIVRMRTINVTTGIWRFVVAVNWYLDGDNLVQPRLEIWPTPTADADSQLYLTYRARWVECTSDTVDARVPWFMESLLAELCRAFARGWEMEDQATLAARLADIQAGPVFAAAVKHDTGVQSNLGPMRGGLLSDPLGVVGYDSFPAAVV